MYICPYTQAYYSKIPYLTFVTRLFSVHSAGEARVGPQSPAKEEGDIRRLHPRLDGVCSRAGDRRHPALCRKGCLPSARELPQTQERYDREIFSYFMHRNLHSHSSLFI